MVTNWTGESEARRLFALVIVLVRDGAGGRVGEPSSSVGQIVDGRGDFGFDGGLGM